jgi:septal ring factor EnvC (AmiA/AmiB activator)
MRSDCRQKNQQRIKVQSDIKTLKMGIEIIEKQITQYNQQIAAKIQNIKLFEAKFAVHTTLIAQYELCDRQLKVKPIITSR